MESCEVCQNPKDEEKLLMCTEETCERLYHIYCLVPPLEDLPPDDEDWFCPGCQKS